MTEEQTEQLELLLLREVQKEDVRAELALYDQVDVMSMRGKLKRQGLIKHKIARQRGDDGVIAEIDVNSLSFNGLERLKYLSKKYKKGR